MQTFTSNVSGQKFPEEALTYGERLADKIATFLF